MYYKSNGRDRTKWQILHILLEKSTKILFIKESKTWNMLVNCVKDQQLLCKVES